MRPVTYSLNINNNSATKIANAQTTAGAGNLVLNAAASAIDSSGAARIVLITTTADTHTISFTITGKDADGNVITETHAFASSATTVASTNAYASISQISVNGAVANNVSFGTTNTTLTAYGATLPIDFYTRSGFTAIVEVTGTIVYTVQETFYTVLSSGTANAIWFDGSLSMSTQNTSGGGTVGANLVSQSSVNSRSQLDAGATGTRIKILSYSNGATLTLRLISEPNTDKG